MVSDFMFVEFTVNDIDIIVYRDDLNHPKVSGNKLHKLSPNIDLAKERECSCILSFGGPYSNHLHALAWASREAGIDCIGGIRGELNQQLTPTLKDCLNWGMQMVPIHRDTFRNIRQALLLNNRVKLASELKKELNGLDIHNPDKTLVLPEGGSNQQAIKSLSQAYKSVFDQLSPKNITHVVCSSGTGATIAGLYLASPPQTKIIGMQAVAEQNATFQRIQAWLKRPLNRLSIVESHLGRFGKITPELKKFIESFELEFGIPLDPIYTGKAMMKLMDKIEQGFFNNSDRILFIHTGGLQGKR